MNTRQTLELERQRLTERHQEQPEGRLFAPLADCHRKLGNLDQALQLCERGLSRHPNYSSAYVILGKIHRDRADLGAARAAFEKVLELDAQNLLALRQLAEIEEEAGALDDAARWWEKVAGLEIDPSYAEEKASQLRGTGTVVVTNDAEPATVSEGAEPAAATPVPHVEPTDEVTSPGAGPSDTPSPRANRKAAVPTSEIATMTLAEIYAEQGFKAKALEIYRQIFGRNPEVATLAERISALEKELASSVVVRPAAPIASGFDDRRGDEAEEAHLEELEDPYADHAIVLAATDSVSTEGPRPAVGSEVDAEPEVRPSPPLESTVAEKDEESQERERYNHFRTWLDRIRVDDH